MNPRATLAKSAYADYLGQHNAQYQAQSWGEEPAQAGFADVARGFSRRAVSVQPPLPGLVGVDATRGAPTDIVRR